MTGRLFRDRHDAGRVLAGLLDSYRGRPDVVVLALPRGGVPVGYEVARALGAPLEVWDVARLDVPGREDLALGAIGPGGTVVLDDDIVRGLRIPPDVVERIADRQSREPVQRNGPGVGGRKVILVDDGLATGTRLRAAVRALRGLGPARIVVALPTVPESTHADLVEAVDEVLCATTPSPFVAADASYWDNAEVPDEEVHELLRDLTTVAPDPPPPPAVGQARAAADVRAQARPGRRGIPTRDLLFDLVGDARFVLLGGSSHGTHEFSLARAVMTRHLIEKRGFCAVAVDADWPDAYRVNRYVRGHGTDVTPEQALRAFERFPSWVWRNDVVLDFVGWLRDRNDRAGRDQRAKAGCYGLDLFGLSRSTREVAQYLERIDPAAAARARSRYAGLDHAGDGVPAYGVAAAFGAGERSEREIIDQLVDRQRHALERSRRDGLQTDAGLFNAETAALLMKASAEYYRSMFASPLLSSNLRGGHMADTLDALANHLTRQRGEPAKIVVWAHNSHVGDARATELGSRGELSLGQLVRARHPDHCRLIGFTTHTGTVTAADDWGGPAQRKWVRPPLPDSVEGLLSDASDAEILLSFNRPSPAGEVLRSARLERAIGVVYRPQTERPSHYFRARLADQFDAIIHIDQTRALEPLERSADWERGELPEIQEHTRT
jgi:erythromycin esterase-like protein/predicted phosphoribosyltransferase